VHEHAVNEFTAKK